MSDSYIVSSLLTTQGSRRPSITDNDDTQSITSSRASVVKRSMTDDGVKLYVYGIDEVGMLYIICLWY